MVNFVCTMAEIWSSFKGSYIGITIHWIDCNTFVRKSVALARKKYKGVRAYDEVVDLIADTFRI